ncbi:hypothetical protein M2272_000856 [Mycobacterium frederiksbergense]|uniref:DUF7159 domain-containing protein n=1 Tax=Mycolicibacterium frederiksbergense TaxID=117567 RepID=A0ABT6KU40_9MYCO|nr:hypothetical protein [Mycolicibacterium frederiksbergense]MDH6194235.1 hypothetical protein [Mycolicibacterium frederiksbergense]
MATAPRGVHVEAVLGVSITPSTVGLILVEGAEANGATIDHDAIDIRGHSASRTDQICDQVVAAIRRAEAVAAEHGRRLATIGVTWSAGAGSEAAVLLGKLAAAGLAGVVPVRLPHATDALARGIAGIVGFETTGVCVLEPDVVQAMTVGGDIPVHTTFSRGIETVAGLTQWLLDMFAAAVPRPDALVVVGAAVDLDAVLPKLEQALAVPVFTPAEPGLPLARGAALASVRRGRRGFSEDSVVPARRRWVAAQLVPLAILVCGLVTFVVSLSLAISLQLLPSAEQPTPHRTTRPAVSTSGASVSVRQAPPVAIPAAPVPVPDDIPVLEPAAAPGMEPGMETVPPESQPPLPAPLPPEPPAAEVPPAAEPVPPPFPDPEVAPPPPEAVAPAPELVPDGPVSDGNH